MATEPGWKLGDLKYGLWVRLPLLPLVKHEPMSKEDRQNLVDTTEYQWEICVGCGRSEKDYFLETGWAGVTCQKLKK